MGRSASWARQAEGSDTGVIVSWCADPTLPPHTNAWFLAASAPRALTATSQITDNPLLCLAPTLPADCGALVCPSLSVRTLAAFAYNGMTTCCVPQP